MQKRKKTTHLELVLCPSCGCTVKSKRMEKHLLHHRRQNNAPVLCPACGLYIGARYSEMHRLYYCSKRAPKEMITPSSQASFCSRHVVAESETSAYCRHCGNVAIPGDRVCYACANGGG